MREALEEARAYRDPVNEASYSTQQIRMAYGILNDPRYKQGNYSGAVRAIEKIAKGLSNHPDVANALRRANEELQEASKFLRYSNLLIQKGRMQRAGDKQGERLTDIEIEKEKKKLGIKDEFIPEGMVKRVMQTVHDKLSKEGGAAGFDDLAKEVKKEFGITISKDTLKNMPGVKQHRDGDYILEGTMIGGIVTDNSGKKMPGYDKAKKALKDFMSKPQPAKGASDKVMSFIFDDELLDDLYVASKKNMSDVRPMVKKRLKALGIKEDLEEETITEFKKMVVTIADPMKRAKAMDDIKRFGKGTGFRIDKMSDGKSFRIDGKGADLNKFATDMKNFYGAEIKAESLEEAFTRADFAKLEADNEHGEAAKKLIDKFGTADEKKEIDAINKRHEQTGYIKGPDYQRRTQIVNKYYSRLK